jgi:hypothetical protein
MAFLAGGAQRALAMFISRRYSRSGNFFRFEDLCAGVWVCWRMAQARPFCIIDKRSAEMCVGLGRSLSKGDVGHARLCRACAHIPYLDGIMTVRRFGKGGE